MNLCSKAFIYNDVLITGKVVISGDIFTAVSNVIYW